MGDCTITVRLWTAWLRASLYPLGHGFDARPDVPAKGLRTVKERMEPFWWSEIIWYHIFVRNAQYTHVYAVQNTCFFCNFWNYWFHSFTHVSHFLYSFFSMFDMVSASCQCWAPCSCRSGSVDIEDWPFGTPFFLGHVDEKGTAWQTSRMMWQIMITMATGVKL